MDDWEKLEDGELLARTARCPEAFGVFYRRHLDGVVRFVGARVASPELAADVVAEVFAAGLMTSSRFDSRQGTARAWLLGIASHKVADVTRQQLADRRLQRRLGMSEIMWTEEDLARIERLRGPDEASAADLLMELPSDQRHAVGQRVLAERDYPDIARAAQSSEGVIRKRVSRGLATLRIWLGEQR